LTHLFYCGTNSVT